MKTLIENSIFYIVLFVIAYYKPKKFTAYNVSILWFLLVAVMGVYSYSIGAYSATFKDNGVFTLEPYIYCFISVLLFVEPLRKFNNSDYTVESYTILNSKKLFVVRKVCFWLFLLLTLSYLVTFLRILGSGQGLADAYNAYHEEGSTVLQMSNWQSKTVWLISPIQIALSWFVLLIAIEKFNDKATDRWNWFYVALFAITPDVLSYMSRAARGEFLYMFLKLALFFVLIWKILNSSIKKIHYPFRDYCRLFRSFLYFVNYN